MGATEARDVADVLAVLAVLDVLDVLDVLAMHDLHDLHDMLEVLRECITRPIGGRAAWRRASRGMPGKVRIGSSCRLRLEPARAHAGMARHDAT